MWPETERVPADSRQQGEPLSLTAHKELSPANSYVSLKVHLSPVKPWMRPSLVYTLIAALLTERP